MSGIMRLSILSILAIIGFSVYAESQDSLKEMPEADTMMLASSNIDNEQVYC